MLNHRTKAIAIIGIAVGGCLLYWGWPADRNPASAIQTNDSSQTAASPEMMKRPIQRNTNAEDLLRSSATLSEAVAKLLPRAKAGEIDAIRVLTPTLAICEAFNEGGRSAYDAYVPNKDAVAAPKRQALITKRMLFCKSAGPSLAEAQEVVRDQGNYVADAIRRGNPEAIIEGQLTHDMKRIAPQYATKEALMSAEAEVARSGSPAAKARVAITHIMRPDNAMIAAIDRDAKQAGIANVTELQLAAVQLYGCEVGTDCGPGGQVQESGCLLQGICEDSTVPDYIRNRQFNQQQVAFIDRYLRSLRTQ